MQDKSIEIPFSKWFTSTNLHPKNIIENILFTGLENEKNYIGYILFDKFNCPKDFYINSAFLRIYLKELQTSLLWSNLYIEPIENEFDVFKKYIECNKNQVCHTVNANFHGWMDINISNLVCNNECTPDRTKGLMLISDKKQKSLFIFNSSCNDDYELQPKLIIRCSPSPHKENNGIMNVKETNWTLNFFKNGVSPIVNITQLNQCTFFIKNTGDELVSATVQVSGDSINWIDDSKIIVDANSDGILIPMYYGKYYRISLSCYKYGCVKILFIYQYFK